MKICCARPVPSDASYFHRLQYDLAHSFHWSGGFCRDLVFYCQQWHPVLGIFCCHPSHPWSKRERAVHLLLSLAFSVLPSALIVVNIHNPYEARSLRLALVSLPNYVWGKLLYQLAIAETRCTSCPMVVTCMQVIEGLCTCMVLAVSVATCTASWLVLEAEHLDDLDHLGEVFRTLSVGLVDSWLLWFLLHLIIPCKIGFISRWRFEARQQQPPGGSPVGQGSASSAAFFS